MLFSGGSEDEANEKIMSFFERNPIFNLVLGIVSAVIGVLKLLSPFENRVPILGDLVPGLAGIAAGFVLVFGLYRKNTHASTDTDGGILDRHGESLLYFRKPLGLVLLAVSLLHFLFPQALFL
jgi:uncharacterized membrane protein HdeD (DUF308 family)